MRCTFKYLKCKRHLPQPATLPIQCLLRKTLSNYRLNTPICFQLLSTCWMVQNICGRKTAMNNNLDFQFGMYEPATDSVITNTGENAILVIRCKECNSSVIFDDPTDIVYLYWLAEESPLLYANLVLKEIGLQDYVYAMNEFN